MQKRFKARTNYLKAKVGRPASFYRLKLVEFLSDSSGLSQLIDNDEAFLLFACWIYPQEVLENPKSFGNEDEVRK